MAASSSQLLLSTLGLISLVVTCGAVASKTLAEPRGHEGVALAMLDSMEHLLEGGGEFDRVFWDKLTTCWNETNTGYHEAQDYAWAGMVEFFFRNYTEDPWGGCQVAQNETNPDFDCHTFLEKNETVMDYQDVIIYEPCNFASNMAYYHVSTELCEHKRNNGWAIPIATVDAMTEIMSSLAFGSSFWHGSHTRTGNIADNEIIQVLAYIIHQTMVSPLNSSDPIVTDLSENGTRPFSGVELNGQMTDMFLNVPVRDWGQTILDMDKPNYWRTFAGIITTFFSLTLDDDTADTIIDALADLFNFPEVEYIFLTEKFLPAIRPLMADIELTSLETMQLDANFDSALIKLLYSFLWQEWAIVDSDIWLQPEVNEKGTQLMPVVNAFANVLNNWPEYDQDLQNINNIYPGDSVYCNNYSPHAKWHLEGAPGLQDLIYLSNDVYVTLTDALSRSSNN